MGWNNWKSTCNKMNLDTDLTLFTSEKWKWSRSTLYNSLQPHGLQPTRLLHPWDFPGKNIGVDCHFLLQEIFPTQGLNPDLLHCRQTLYYPSHQESHHSLQKFTQIDHRHKFKIQVRLWNSSKETGESLWSWIWWWLSRYNITGKIHEKIKDKLDSGMVSGISCMNLRP